MKPLALILVLAVIVGCLFGARNVASTFRASLATRSARVERVIP